jgi:hypothetical protein
VKYGYYLISFILLLVNLINKFEFIDSMGI